MASLGNLVVNIGANAGSFFKTMNAVTNAMTQSKLRRGANGLNFGVTALEGAMTRAGVKANMITAALQTGFGWLQAMTTQAIQLAAATERTKLTFELLTGDIAIGNALFAELEKIAGDTALTLDDTTAAARQLLVSFDASQIPYLVKMLGSISATMDNVSLQEMAYLLQTSREEGKLLARDLRQFTTRGIPVPKALQEVLGLVGPNAGAELNDMITRGEVGIGHLMKALEKLAEGDALGRMGETTMGRWHQMIDAMLFMLRDLGTMFLEVFDVKTVLANVTAFLRGMRENLWKAKAVIQQVYDALLAWVELARTIGTTFLDMFDGMINDSLSFGEMWMVVYATIEFAATHFFDLLTYGFGNVKFLLVYLGEEFMHFFGVVIPTYAGYLVTLFKNLVAVIFTELIGKGIANATILLEHLIKRMALAATGPAGIIAALRMAGPQLIGFDPNLGGMFEAPPVIPEREISQAEKDLGAMLQREGNMLGEDFRKAIEEALRAFNEQKPPELPEPLPAMKPFDFGAGLKEADDGKQRTENPALLNRTHEAWKAIVGSMKDPTIKALNRHASTAEKQREAMVKRLAQMAANQPVVVSEFWGGI